MVKPEVPIDLYSELFADRGLDGGYRGANEESLMKVVNVPNGAEQSSVGMNEVPAQAAPVSLTKVQTLRVDVIEMAITKTKSREVNR